MEIQYFICVCVLQVAHCQLKPPDFVSEWTTISAGNDSDLSTHHVYHGLGETPLLVDVQVKAIDGPNEGFIFQASGHVIRDDDEPEGYGNVVYIYDDEKVIVSAPVTSDGYLGRAIYIGPSPYWEGPVDQVQDSYSAVFRVRAWKASSLPEPDFNQTSFTAARQYYSFLQFDHNFGMYPDLVISRIHFPANTVDYPNFFADSVGTASIFYDSYDDSNGYVIFGFDNSSIRVWHSLWYRSLFYEKALFDGRDGGGFNVTIYEATLEVYAWKHDRLQPVSRVERNINSDTTPEESSIGVPYSFSVEDAFTRVWVRETGD